MTESWSSILPQLLIGLVWPVAILLLAIAFRKGIKPRFKEGRGGKDPGGSITKQVNDPAERMEKSRKDERVSASDRSPKG